MPLVARGDQSDIVNTGHAVCLRPGQIATLSCSGDVFVHNIGAHRLTDTNTPHTHCPPVYSTNVNAASPNVFVNNLAIARLNDTYSCGAYIQAVNQSDVFANDPGGENTNIKPTSSYNKVPASDPVTIDPYVQGQINKETDAYVAAQTGVGAVTTNTYYNASAARDGVKGNYAGTPDDGTVSTGTISVSTSSSDIIPFLTQTLGEAAKGLWRETGQGGNPSNPNILGIWSNLGYPKSGAWLSDQTAWCMGFVNFALKCSGYKYVQTASAAAITTNPERWNAVQVPKDQAQPGDIAFWSYRHVNFVYTAKNGVYTFVGGNQSPKASNNPNDGDVTISYPNGTHPSNSNWVSCWRPSKT